MKLEVLGRLEPGKVLLAFPPNEKWRSQFLAKGFVRVMDVTNTGGMLYTSEPQYERALNSVPQDKLNELCVAVGVMGEPVVIELSEHNIKTVELGDPNDGD